MNGHDELSFTRVARSEAMVQMIEDEMVQDMFTDNVLQDLTGDAC